jgi:glycosyltransferase involved in cell wall biosynthesis
MRIAHISTYDIQGGAARAAYRLHQGLIELGTHSRMLSVHKASTDETVQQIRPRRDPDAFAPEYLERLQQGYINSNRTPISNTLFTLPYPGCDLTGLRDVMMSDVVNLHWVAFLQSPTTIGRLLRLDRPVVWTLHDMWAFTGGCHFSAGCTRYEHDCWPCPQLRDDPHRLPAAVLGDRFSSIPHPRLVVVAPSQWLATCARQSLVFRHTRIEVIPNSLQTDVFTPEVKAEAKRLLGISPDTLILLAGAHDANERRKGFAELAEALRICAADAGFQKLLQRDKVKILSFGLGPGGTGTSEVPVVPLGPSTSDDELRRIYSAADIFVLPSLDDNLPNTMLEAMSCGTPVVAFGAGGIPEVVDDGVTGRVVPVGTTPRMAGAILDCLRNHEARKRMGAAARRVIETRYSLPVQARRYHDLYQEILGPGRPLAPIARQRGTAAASAISGRGGQPDSVPVPLDYCLGRAFEPVFHRWATRAAHADLERARADVEQARADLARAHVRLAEVEPELSALRSEVGFLRGGITAMESSKFWKLRRLWFRFKRAAGMSAP